MRGFFSAESGEAVLLFVRQFYMFSSMHLWQYDSKSFTKFTKVKARPARQRSNATVASQVPKPRMSPDFSREKAQSCQVRRESVGSDGRRVAVEVLKAKLIKARAVI